MTEGQRALYENVKRNPWIFELLKGCQMDSYSFWGEEKRYELTLKQLHVVLARLVLEGVVQ